MAVQANDLSVRKANRKRCKSTVQFAFLFEVF